MGPFSPKDFGSKTLSKSEKDLVAKWFEGGQFKLLTIVCSEKTFYLEPQHLKRNKYCALWLNQLWIERKYDALDSSAQLSKFSFSFNLCSFCFYFLLIHPGSIFPYA